MTNINQYSPRTGRELKEDGTYINTAEMIEAIYNALVVNKNAGVVASGIEIASVTLDDVKIKGAIPEYNWFAGDERPTPDKPAKPAIGVEVDAETGDMVGLLWNGEDWEEA